MNIIFLGTNGWYDTDTGNTICILITSERYQILLDAGNGIYKADRFINKDKPVHLLLSHFHLDHIEGMHVLNKFNFSHGLCIYGQKGTRQILDTIINEPFTIPLSNLPFPVQVFELSEGKHEVPFPLECYYLKHASPCLGYRFELDGSRIAYIPDTGICENAIRLAKDTDLLIAECAHRPGAQNPKWPHLNPQDAVQIARKANSRRLVLVHFDAERYRTLQDRQDAANSVSDFDNLMIAYDDLILEI